MVLRSSLRLIPVLDKLGARASYQVEPWSKRGTRTSAYARGICAVPLRFVKRQVRTLGNSGWTHGHIALDTKRIVHDAKHCVRVTVANAPQHGVLLAGFGDCRHFACHAAAGRSNRSREQVFECSGTDQPSARLADQAWNDEPQPQVPETFGLPNLKPEPLAPST